MFLFSFSFVVVKNNLRNLLFWQPAPICSVQASWHVWCFGSLVPWTAARSVACPRDDEQRRAESQVVGAPLNIERVVRGLSYTRKSIEKGAHKHTRSTLPLRPQPTTPPTSSTSSFSSHTSHHPKSPTEASETYLLTKNFIYCWDNNNEFFINDIKL